MVEKTTPIQRKAKKRAREIAAVERTTDELRALVVAGAEAGTSEVALAEQAGVTRMTIRSWLGK